MKVLFILALQILRFDLHICLNVKVYKAKLTSSVPSFVIIKGIFNCKASHEAFRPCLSDSSGMLAIYNYISIQNSSTIV